MSVRLFALASAGFALVTTAPALAQETRYAPPPGTPTPVTAPDGRTPAAVATVTNGPTGERGPGIDSDRAVNPAPGAGEHPYVGHSADAFYHTRERIERAEQRAASLRGPQRRRALNGIRSIKAELARQEARHGEIRDWDREHLNRRLDALEGSVGLPRANATASIASIDE